nr:hypothetical protein [Myxococcales bacterium]
PEYLGEVLERALQRADAKRREEVLEQAADIASATPEPGDDTRRAYLARFFRVSFDASLDAERVATALRSVSAVNAAYVPPPIVPSADFSAAVADVPITPDAWSGLQGYLAPAPTGIGIEAAHEVTLGEGVGLAVIEIDFPADASQVVSHTQLPDNLMVDTPSCSAHSPTMIRGRRHALRTLGVLLSKPDGNGFTGIVPAAGPVHLVGARPAACSDADKDAAGCCLPDLVDAIRRARNALLLEGTGGVMLIEAQVVHAQPDGTTVLAPIEAIGEVQAAIKLATDAGVTVVEPTGNERGLRLGTLRRPGQDVHDPNDRVFSERSGAILVGAGHHADHQPLGGQGQRVDCFGWGSGVATLDTSPSDAHGYTRNYSGSSSASAIVAGAAVLVQAASKTYRRTLSPKALRNVMRAPDNGTAGVHPGTGARQAGVIGVMPDLGRLMARVRLLTDAVIRDQANHDERRLMAESPDIGIVAGPVAAATADAWAGDLDQLLPVQPQGGTTNHLYVRIHNRGGRRTTTNATVTVLHAPPSTLLDASKLTELATVPLPLLEAAGGCKVTSALPWGVSGALPPGCLVAMVKAGTDPGPDRASLGSWWPYLRAIRHNNVALRTLPAGPAAAGDTYEFTVLAAPDRSEPMALWVQMDGLPAGVSATLDIDPDLAVELGGVAPSFTFSQPRLRLGKGVLTAGKKWTCTLRVNDLASTGAISVVQRWRSLDVGRMTWRFS